MSAGLDEIAIRLGVQKGDLKAALVEANAEIKTFGTTGAKHVDGLTGAVHETTKAMRLFHHLLAAGGLIEAVKGFYEMAIHYAEKHTEDVDEQTQAVRRFGEEMHNVGGAVAKVSVQVIGFLNRAGEGWGTLIGNMIHGREEAERSREVSESAAENIRDIARQHEETLKSIAEIDGQIAAAENKKTQAEFEQLSTQEKIMALNKGLAEQFEILNATAEGSLKHEQSKLQILTWQALAIKTLGEDEKEQASEKAKWNELHKKWAQEDAELDKEVEEDHKQNREAAQAAAEKLRHEEEAVRAESVKIAQAYDDATSSVYKTVEGMRVLKEETRSAIAEWSNLQTKVSGSASYSNMSDAAIMGQIKRQQDLLNSLSPSGGLVRNASQNGDYGSWLSAQLANDQINQAQTVIAQRNSIRSLAASAWGKNQAIMQYGDAAVNQALASMSTDQRNTSVTLNSIATTLNRVFPDQATPVPPTH